MPVTVVLEQHHPRAHPSTGQAKSRDDFLKQSCPEEYDHHTGKTHVRASSFFSDPKEDNNHFPSSSSVVRSAIEAWARHSHLVLRPDDIWLQILVQMNFFMSKNGESLRELFVCHEGKEEIEIIDDDWQTILFRFEEEIQKRVKTPWLAAWINPGFCTTDIHDNIAAIVLMMGLMSTFFEYAADEICGIPSVTLLGTKGDWQRLLSKIDRLPEFGKEPQDYQRRLRPILTRMVRTFDDPSADETKEFWDQLVHAKVKHDITCGEPPLQYIVSGWILGLFYWNSIGYPCRNFSEGRRCDTGSDGALDYDGVKYGEEALENLPVGYAKVTLKSPKGPGQKEEDRWCGWLLAGSIGKSIVSGAPAGYQETIRKHTVNKSSSEKQKTRVSKRQPSNGLSRILRSLSCCSASISDESVAHPSSSVNEKNPKAHVVERRQSEGHSTIQPRSGWILFGPQLEGNPFFEIFEAETWGPTVEAIDGCKGIEHCGYGFEQKTAK